MINSWAYRWQLAAWIQSGLTILPNVNLASNIGFTRDATHTANSNHHLANLPVMEMNFPLKHPEFVIRDTGADTFTQKNIFAVNLTTRVKKKIYFVFNKLTRVGSKYHAS